jgi:ketosteroid isomerase-like protein
MSTGTGTPTASTGTGTPTASTSTSTGTGTPSTGTRAEILALGARWAAAEQAGDTGALGEIAADDFRLVGPFGFVLDKAQWLDRYRTGALATSSLIWDEVEVRDFGATAIAIGRHTQHASYRGQPADGQFRVTHVFVRDGDRWALASLHLSLGAPPPRPARESESLVEADDGAVR